MNNTSTHKLFHGKKWRVLYTRSKWEKKADELLKRAGLNSYCPVVRSQRQWADRKKTVEIPLFTSYVFVEVSPSEEEHALQVNGILGYVKDFGKTAELSAEEIGRIRHTVEKYDDVECIPVRKFSKGDQVFVHDGILLDLKGEVEEIRGKQVVMLLSNLSCGLIAKVKITGEALSAKRQQKFLS